MLTAWLFSRHFSVRCRWLAKLESSMLGTVFGYAAFDALHLWCHLVGLAASEITGEKRLVCVIIMTLQALITSDLGQKSVCPFECPQFLGPSKSHLILHLYILRDKRATTKIKKVKIKTVFLLTSRTGCCSSSHFYKSSFSSASEILVKIHSIRSGYQHRG